MNAAAMLVNDDFFLGLTSFASFFFFFEGGLERGSSSSMSKISMAPMFTTTGSFAIWVTENLT